MFIINNFVSDVFIEKIINENKELLYADVWRSSLGWQEEIISSCGTVLMRDLNDADKEVLKASLIAHNVIQESDKIELVAQTYLWNRLSYIPWHSDKDDDDSIRYAATLYLNHDWDDNWGGLFLYKMDEKIFAESPRYNKFVFNDKNYEHSTSILGTDAPVRQSIQLFWKKVS
jgi:Rps23 Pro-64 3,4-dihydroxylase Tpa1-like proline 4-hydroxylase